MILRTIGILVLLAGSATAAPLAVRVVAIDDAGDEVPVSGARVIVRPASEVVWPEEQLPVDSLATDAEGVVNVPREPGPVTVVAGMALRGTVGRRVGAGESRVKLVLPPEAVLTGVVVGPDGKPVPGAEVILAAERPEDTGDFLAPGTLAVRERADGAGRFVAHRLRPDRRYRIRADWPGLAATTVRDVSPDDGVVTVALGEGATVRGLVIATPGGEPVRGAIVAAGGVSDTTGEDGRFALGGVPAGAWRLTARAAGFLHTEEGELVLRDGDVRVGIVIRVLGMARLTGRVLGPSTEPAPGARILLRYPPDPDLEEVLPEDRLVDAGEADAEGRFDLKGLYPSQGVDLVAIHPDHAPTTYLGFSLRAGRSIDTVVLLREGGRISGRVVTADGDGIAGMRVLAIDDRADLSGLAAGELPGLPTTIGTTSGEDGEFALEHVPGGRHAIVAVGEGRLPAILRGVDIADRSAREGIVLLSGEGHTLAGTVVGPDGGAVSAALVTVRPALGPPLEAETDGEGRFRVPGLPAGRYGLSVTAEGFAPLVLAEIEVPVSDLTLTVTRASGLVGRVVRGDSDEPAGAAVVRALRRGEPSALDPDRPAYAPAGETRTDPADGAFSLGELAPGTYRVEAWTEDGAFGFVDGIRVEAGGSRDLVRVAVEPGQAVTGRVLDAEDGYPVEGASVALRTAGDVPGRFVAATGPDGVFRLPGVPVGFHTLLVTARDRAPRLVADVEVRLAADTEIDDVLLTRGRRVQGVVIGAEGEPRVAIRVLLSSAELGGTRTDRTGERGRFSFAHVAPGDYLVETEDPLAGPGGSRERRLVTVGDDDVFVRFGSGRGTALTGRILSSVGPVAFAEVRLLRAAENTERQVLATRADADGNYLFPDVAPGDLLLLVRPPGSGTSEARFPLGLEPGPVTIHDVYLPDSGLDGVVTDLDTGARLAGATLVLSRAAAGAEGTFLARLDEELGETTSGPEGAFSFRGIPAGSYRLEAYRRGYGRTVVEGVRVSPGGLTPLSVSMPPAGVLRGSVVNEEGRPVTNARLRFLDARGEPATRERFLPVDSRGRFELDTLRTGTYTVVAAAPGYSRVIEEGVEVFPGSVPELELRLAREGRLTIVVYGPGGRPIEGARVSLRDFWGREVPFPEPPVGILTPFRDPALTDEDGAVTVEHLPPGVYVARAAYPGLAGDPARIRVLDGEKSRGALVLLPRGPKKE